MPGPIDQPETTRRDLLRFAGATGLASLATSALAADAPNKPGSSAPGQNAESSSKPVSQYPTGKTFRIGVVSAAIRGKPQVRNGHTWHFAQYLHPTMDMDAYKKVYPQAYPSHVRMYRNPRYNFDLLPFPDTRITHYYDADPKAAADFAAVFPGVKAATSLEEMVKEVDAVWMGDASGYGEDHFDLVAPGLARGLPTFCDKPIGGTVEGTRKILEFARKNKAPIMSSSLFRHEFGMENALRWRDTGEFGQIEWITATLQSRYGFDGWMIYGQHPAWTVMTLMGPGVDAVSMYEYKDTCHSIVTYKDRYPAHIWYGQPYENRFEYDMTEVYFKKKIYRYTSSIEGDFEYGHHYEMFRMAATFRQMLLTGIEPVPHQEILEVTAIVHAGAKSLKEKSRLVEMAEVLS